MDFYDKLITAIVCVIVTFICVFNTFSFAETSEIPSDFYEVSQELFLTDFSFNLQGELYEQLYSSIYRVTLKKGSNYILLSSLHYFGYAFSNIDDLTSSDSLEDVSLSSSDSLVYVYNNGDYKYLYLTYYSDNDVTVYSNANNFIDVVNSLSECVGIDNIWETFEISLPYVGVVVLSGFGFYLIFHNIKELSKGREKMN